MRSIFACTWAMAFVCTTSAADKHQAPVGHSGYKTLTIEELSWTPNLTAALVEATKDKKLVFIDFTGESCVNCKVNEKKVFTKPEVKDLFKQYVRVQLFTDIIPEDYYQKAPKEESREKDAETNAKFQKKILDSNALPMYVIVKPVDGGMFEIVGKYDEGRISKIDQFLEFLKTPLGAK
ncbi:MAG: thioredoxin family protein [Planctomycetes bacterium]|nr:thioredoxin family protein [Planctomycetota bacterium]